MTRRCAAAALAAAVASAACAPALHEAPSAPERLTSRSADDVLRDADAAWARRADLSQARAAEALYVEAAAADDRRVEGLLGAMRAIAYLLERERDAGVRGALAERAAQLGQWCQRRAPGSAACDYRLAIALGQQARERTATARDALSRMVKLLRQAIAADPRMDDGGPHRVLALVLLRAPAWPIGPGDPEAALAEAQAAVALFPDAPENQLVLAEALAKNERADDARAAYGRAADLASRLDPAREPEAPRWREQAIAGAGRGASR